MAAVEGGALRTALPLLLHLPSTVDTDIAVPGQASFGWILRSSCSAFAQASYWGNGQPELLVAQCRCEARPRVFRKT